MTWEDFSDPVDDWESFSDPVSAEVDQFMDSSGLGFLDTAFKGGLSQTLERNISNPYWEPGYYDRIARARQDEQDRLQQEMEDRARIQSERERLLAEDEARGQGFEDLDYGDRALLGLSSGLESLQRQAGGLIESGLPGTINPALKAFEPLYEEYGSELARSAREEQIELNELSQTPKADIGGEFIQWLTENATSVLPSLAIGVTGGFPAAVAASGAQSLGAVFEDAKDSYMAQGYSEDESRQYATGPALLAGVITSALTGVFGRTGVEAISRGLTYRKVKDAIRRPVETLLAGTQKEGTEEALDQLAQGFVAKASYDPNRPIEQIFLETLEAGAAGGALGFIGEGVTTARLNTARALRGVGRPDAPATSRTVPDEYELLSRAISNPAPATPRDDTRRTFNLPDRVFNLPDRPAEQPKPTPTRRLLRRGEGLQKRILIALGVDPETADDFLAQYTGSSSGNLEQMREELLSAFTGMGLTPESSYNVHPESPETYLSAGLSQEETNEYVQLAIAKNQEKRAQLKAANKNKLKGEPNAIASREIIESDQPQYLGDDQIVQTNGQTGQLPAQVIAQSPEAGSGSQLPQSGQVEIPAPVLIPPVTAPVTEPTPVQPVPAPVQPPVVPVPPEVPQRGQEVFGDIIEYIQNNIGAIRGKKTAKPGSKAYYGEEYKEVLNFNSVRPLFSNSRGSSPDEIVDDLRRAGLLPESASVDDLWPAIKAAALNRKALRADATKEKNTLNELTKQRIAFEKAITKKPGTSPIPVSDLVEGDTFNIGKEKFTVKAVDYNPDTDQVDSIQVVDGPKYEVQTLNGQQVIYGRNFKPNESATEFVTESTQSTAEVTRIDREINRLREKDRLTPEQFRQLDALEQERGQVMAFDQETLGTPQAATETVTTPEQRQAMMQGEQGRAIEGGAVQTQGEMFQAGPPETLFGQIGGTQTIAEPVLTKTLDELRAAINRSNLPELVKRGINVMLDTPAMRNLDWNGLLVELAGQTDAFRAARTGHLIQLTDNIQSGDFTHELFHVFYDFLPANYKAEIERARQAELINRFGQNVPPELAAGNMTSNEFKESGLSADDYHLINPSEYLATFAGNKFAKDLWYRRHGNTFVKQLKAWFNALTDALNRAFRIRPNMQRIFREVLAGRFQPDLQSGLIHEERQGTYSRSAADAVNAQKLARTTEERQVQGWHQLAQSTDILGFLDRFGVNAATVGVKKVLGYDEYTGINSVGKKLNFGLAQTYRDLKSRIIDDYQRGWMSVMAGEQMANFSARLEEAAKKGREALKEITRPAFLKRFQRDIKLRTNLDTAEIINRASTPVFESAYRMAERALREEARNDVEIARIEAQLNEIDVARRSSSAMSGLITDMVNALSSTPEGQILLANPDVRRADLIRVYRDIKSSTSQPVANESIINWGAFILARNTDLRDTLWAAQLSRNSNIRSGMGAYQTKLLSDLERDARGTIVKEIRASKRRQKVEDQSRFAWLTLHKEIVDDLTQAGTAIDAGSMAETILGERDFKILRKEMFTDAKIEGTNGGSFMPLKDEIFLTPSGKRVEIGTKNLRGTKVTDSLWGEWEAARNELKDWLNDPDNFEDPNYEVHGRNLYNLEEYYYQETILAPHDREQIFDGMMTTISSALRGAGGRVAAAANRVANRFSLLKEQAGMWRQKYGQEMVIQRVTTMNSHGLKWKGNGGVESIEVVAHRFARAHLNQVAYSLNKEAGGLQVGDRTSFGIITQEDINDVKLQSEITSKGFKILEDNFGGEDFVIEDSRSGVTVQRRPSKGTQYFVPRVFQDLHRTFVSDFYQARKEYRDARAQGDTARMNAANAQQIQLLNQNWSAIVYPMLWDRNPDFAQSTPFDGPGNAFEQLSQQLELIPDSIADFADLVDQLVTVSSTTRAEAESIVLDEWGRILEDLGKEIELEPSLAQTAVTGDQKNAFTRGRGQAMAPYAFYSYGFQHTNDLSRLSGTIYSRALLKLTNGLTGVRDDLNARIADLDIKTAQGQDRSTAIRVRAREKANGRNFDTLTDLQSKLVAVNKVIDHLTVRQPEEDGDINFMRTIGAVTGGLVANSMTTAVNMVAGPKYVGTIGMRLNARGLFEFKDAVWYAVLVAQSKAVWGAVRGITPATLRLIPSFVKAVRAVSAAANKGKRLRAGSDVLFASFLTDMSRVMHERNKITKELSDKGLVYIHDVGREWTAKMAAGIANAGTIQEREMSRLRKLGQLPAAALETILVFLKGTLPALGEHGINAAIYQTHLKGPNSHKAQRQAALDKVWDNYVKNNYRLFNFRDIKDPINRLSYEELIPAGLTEFRFMSGRDDLEFIETLYQDAGLSFQEESMRYLAQKEAGNPTAEYLAGDSELLMANYLLGLGNKATPINTPIVLTKRDPLTQITRPLLGWSARTLNSLTTLLSVPATSEKSQAMRWALMMTVAALPMLLAFAGLGLIQEKEARLLSKYFWNQERAARYPWEREGIKSQAIGWTIAATYGIPFVDRAVNAMLNDTPTRASLDPSFVMINKFKDAMRYFGGVVQTGDPTFGLAQFIQGFFPDARAILNRLESESGKRLGSDVVALARRAGPQDLLKASNAQMGGPNFTELSPYGPAMENAAMNGNVAEVQRLFEEAIQKATEMGREDPEQLVRQLFQARNPFNRAFTQKISEEQKEKFLAKLDPDEREKVERALANFKAAGDAIGVTVSTTREESPRYSGGGTTGRASAGLSPATLGYLRRSSGNQSTQSFVQPRRLLRRGSNRTSSARTSTTARRTLRRRRTSLRRRNRPVLRRG